MKPTNYSAGSQFKSKIFIPLFRIEFTSKTNILLFVVFPIIVTGCFMLLLSLFVNMAIVLASAAILFILIAMTTYYILETKNEKYRDSQLKVFYYQEIKRYKKVIDQDGRSYYIPDKQEGRVYEGRNIL